jgi:hypothetical protein
VITGAFAQGDFYGSDRRSVSDEGVAAVMRIFFDQHPPVVDGQIKPAVAPTPEDIHCEEQMVEAFGP